jgi:ureidoglycolate hydrolase
VTTPKDKNGWLDVIAREIGLWPAPTLEELRAFIATNYRGANVDIEALHADLFGSHEEE